MFIKKVGVLLINDDDRWLYDNFVVYEVFRQKKREREKDQRDREKERNEH